MRCLLRFLPLLLYLAANALAQSPAAPAGAPPQQGFTPEWDIRAVLKEIAAHGGRLAAMLDKSDPAGWVQKGAPDAYAAQWKSARAQALALSGEAAELALNPEKLAPALKAFFRMQSLEFTIGSLTEALRRYQSPDAAGALAALAAENGANRERFQTYIVELAAHREEEYRIMDYEAQRCRGMLSRETPARKPTGKKN